ncbi:MAG: ubiquinol-cytochrome c reductase iron-sulfur subunit [Nitrospira sp.]
MKSSSLSSEAEKVPTSNASPPQGTRRGFFGWMIGIAASVIGLSLAIPLAGYVISPALKRRKSLWAEAGPTDSLRPGEPQELEYASTVKDGWRTVTAKKAIWAVQQPAGDIVVFSPICPHLGCGFRWEAGDHKFHCPCHGSVYDATGKVLAGPAPRSLDVLPSKVEQGKLFIIYKEFKSGLDHPVEL